MVLVGLVMSCSIRTVHRASYGSIIRPRGAPLDIHTTPFETQMLRDATLFVGRWSELQLVMHAIDKRRPVLVVAPPRSGKSSLLFHAVAAGGILLDHDDLPAFYLDMAEFPDYEAVETTIAEAFAPPGTPWLQAILRPATAPLLAFDNIDAPQFAPHRDAFMAQLANECAAGRLRVIAAASQLDAVPAVWERVHLGPVGQSFLREYLDVCIPDGPHPDRADQTYMVVHARGHVGTMIVILTLWYRAQRQSDLDWRTLAAALTPPQPEQSIGGPRIQAEVSWGSTTDPIGGESPMPAHSAPPSTKPVADGITVGNLGWFLLVSVLIGMSIWIWRG